MSDAGDRTIPATPRRRELARRQGAMPAASLPAWVAAAATAVLLLPAWSRATFPAATEMMRAGIVAGIAAGAQPRTESWLRMDLAIPTVALVSASGVVGLAVRLLLDGGGWRLGRAAPSLLRISPLAGLARIFSARTAVDTALNAVGLALMAAAACGSAGGLAAVLASPQSAADPLQLVPPLQRMLVAVTAAAAVLAVCQWGLARLRFERRIRMTPQEFTDEQRSMQAAPQVRLLLRRRPPPATPPRSAAADLQGAMQPAGRLR